MSTGHPGKLLISTPCLQPSLRPRLPTPLPPSPTNLEICLSSSLWPSFRSIKTDLFFLCFQESRSGESNSCVEEIIRVRIIFKIISVCQPRTDFQQKEVLWPQDSFMVCCLMFTWSEDAHLSHLSDTSWSGHSFQGSRSSLRPVALR